ncbi:hypothetical protein FACS1894182_02430 [Bacteroidia bacterium]|nr:hypothetical protein FACS1894182_02430 [Bacteroidia bacterium]
MESMDGYTLMYDVDKYIVYAEQNKDADLVPSKHRYHTFSVAPGGLKKGILYSPSQVRALEQIWEVTENTSNQRAGATVGQRKALCVLMGFRDKLFSRPNSEFETLFNQVGLYPADGTSKGSVRDFFRENSYGQLDFTVTIVGPYNAPNTCKYYATHEQEFAEIAARAANADVNYNDFADNGRLETFHILFAGYGDEAIDNGNQIWSHKWQLASPITLDGVRISVYSCSPELRDARGDNTTYVGVICHELSHVFGAPDYYDTGSAGYKGSGNWDLMAGGNWNDNGRQPAHINMFQKILYGWVTPVELTSYTEIPAMSPSAQEPVAYTIRANENGELYVLENRQKVGFDASIPGHGLLIWHVHPKALTGRGNNDEHPQQLYPVVASSTYSIPTGSVSSYGSINSAGTPFPGSVGKDAFTARTTPAMFTWTGLQTISKPITEITEASDKTVSFKFMAGPAVPVTGLQAEVTGGNVKLAWEMPAHEAVLGYKIYRNDVLQYTINNKTTTSYTQAGVTNGIYTYGVSAFYESNESAIITVSVTVSDGSDTYYLPVSNLQGRTTLDQASLNWTAPFVGGWMTIADSSNGLYVYSFNQELTFFAGTLWGPEHLKGLNGYKATQIQFYLNAVSPGSTYKAQIWEVDNIGKPMLVLSQDYTGNMFSGIRTVTFDSPLVIDASKEYIMGMEIHVNANLGSLATDANTADPGRNWMCVDNEWFTLDEVGVEENFYTSVYLTSGQSSSSDNPVQYIIYRDGERIGETFALLFEDNHLNPKTTYSYCVSATYGDNKNSESVCIELTTQPSVHIQSINASTMKVYPNPVKAGQDFSIKTGTPDAVIQVFSLAGTLVKQQQSTGLITQMNLMLPPGIYILSAGEEKTRITIR